MYSTFGFGEYHRKRAERNQKIKFFCYAAGFALIGVGLIVLCGFLASII